MKKFYLLRHEDVSGRSGTGVVAEGVIFNDGTGAFTWLSPIKTITIFQRITDIQKLHGHGGRTEVVLEGTRKFRSCQKIALIKSKHKSFKNKHLSLKGSVEGTNGKT